MFELDTEVRNWRTRLERGSSLSARELDELEDHLRARVSLELDLNPALPPAKAFTTAVSELGEPKAISREFAKAGRPRWRRLFLTGWALYVASFFLPAWGIPGGIPSRPDADSTTYAYEMLTQLPAGGQVMFLLSNLIMLLTLPALRRPRPSRKLWWAWLVGATGAFPFGVGVLRVVDGGMGLYPDVGFWLWSASFLVVATALWRRKRDWASVQSAESIAQL
ncbi:MAG: hypothetical protein OXJ54_14335 [Gemmatimonadetes bacterium]|nr:hypothetical protein [Candidatus Palauibacter rhopaloidicola]